VLETLGIDVDDALVAGWRGRVERARHFLKWDIAFAGPSLEPPHAPAPHHAVVCRRHATGASLALAAPLDQLFTATEVNEWALCATLHARDPLRWDGLVDALFASYVEEATDPATVIPPVLDEHPALARLQQLATAERRPDICALIEAAEAHGVWPLLDEKILTLGAGAGGQGWPLDALPARSEVSWDQLHQVPVAVVTGSNGKTTTVRLIAACAREHGWRDGFSCTDGVFIGRELVNSGDYSGPAGTRRVLRDTRVEAAVLETARGGILRRGLAVDHATVALVTNISADHFGEYGIHDLDGLADVKLTVAQLVRRDGLLVLNADDDLLRRKCAALQERLGWQPRLGWFSLEFDRPELVSHRAARGVTCGVRAGRLLLSDTQGREHDLGAIDALPLTVNATATYNIANLAGAAIAASALGIPAPAVRTVFAKFAADPADNSGRLMRFEVGGVSVIVDYAHNPDGLRGVLHVAGQLRSESGRLGMLIGHAGNRLDADIEELAATAVTFEPALVVVKEDEGHLRGRQPGEVPAILQAALLKHGLPESAVVLRMSEVEASRHALDWARPGDALALLVHSTANRAIVVEMLRARAGT
jgi:UDP-N-acetylmuramyl tripeptide synthase